jgi:hypothetical protein
VDQQHVLIVQPVRHQRLDERPAADDHQILARLPARSQQARRAQSAEAFAAGHRVKLVSELD